MDRNNKVIEFHYDILKIKPFECERLKMFAKICKGVTI